MDEDQLADARLSIELITAMYYSSETGHGVTLPIGTHHRRYASWLPSDAADCDVGRRAACRPNFCS
jgi:hypothetical protein